MPVGVELLTLEEINDHSDDSDADDESDESSATKPRNCFPLSASINQASETKIPEETEWC